MLPWLLFAAIGKLFIYLFMKFPLPQVLSKNKFLKGLHSCGLCSGVWIYTTLSFLLNIDLLSSWFGLGYVMILSEIVTGCVTSYIVHLLSIGFTEYHTKVIIV